MKVYLAGPMTGIPQFNIPAFDALAGHLRNLGLEVVSPAELDSPTTRAAALASPDGAPGTGSASDETWGDFLARDIKLIANNGIDAVVVLPGWESSKGARLETFFAAAICHLPVFAAVLSETLGILSRIDLLDLVAAWVFAKGTDHFVMPELPPAPGETGLVN